MGSESLLSSIGNAQHIEVERALTEFRSARPVIIRSGVSLLLAFPLESITDNLLPLLQQGKRAARVIVASSKVKAATGWDAPIASVELTPLTSETIAAFFNHGQSRNGLSGQYSMDISPPAHAETAALALANLALLLPAAIVCEVDENLPAKLPVLAVDADAVLAFRSREANDLRIVARTIVPLEGVGRSEFVVFRGGDGFRDQIAVIVSEPSPSRPVLARIHSACLTGDLFGSLKCDCGDQLRGTVQSMAEQGGGIVLYLDQEGRGNGIANKIRAYGLQAEGHDTYDADALLGFGKDQRRFDFAAEMLRQLGFTSIRLMTNNPQKIEALRSAGLEVVSTHRVLARTTAHNLKYLTAKRDKAGHLLDEQLLDSGITGS